MDETKVASEAHYERLTVQLRPRTLLCANNENSSYRFWDSGVYRESCQRLLLLESQFDFVRPVSGRGIAYGATACCRQVASFALFGIMEAFLMSFSFDVFTTPGGWGYILATSVTIILLARALKKFNEKIVEKRQKKAQQ
jgi:hypothetical protein